MRRVLFGIVVSMSLALSAQAQPPASKSARSGPSAFNPDFSLILNGTYGSFSRDPETYALPGFPLGGETGPGERGFALSESELVVSANIDHLFFGNFIGAVSPEGEFEVEEAYVQTLALPAGFTLKAGRFLSGIGYLNGQHPHRFDFVDTALPYRAFLANRYGDDGAQLRWLAPTALFIELGAEWMRGDAFPAGGAANKGRGTVAGFVHFGGDVGVSHSWRGGVSRLRAQADERLTGDIDNAPDAFTGTSDVSVLDIVWKWAPNGNARRTNFKLQGEYLWREEQGEFVADVNGAGAGPNTDAYRSDQTGWYLQAVYQFMPRWRVGVRHDELRTRELEANSNDAVLDTAGHRPRRDSLMVDFSASEYSRLRLQFNRDRSQPETDNQVMLQYIMSLGAHGAHTF